MIDARRKVYIWPTWISGLLSGDKHCGWAAWLRAHYFYTKRVDEHENSLTQWKAEHAEDVARRAIELEDQGWRVRQEEQNKFSYYGKVATVGGCPDLVGFKEGLALIEDVKTGKERDSDFWQVAIYGMLLPLCDRELDERVVHATVVYSKQRRTRAISPQHIEEAKPLIVERIKTTASAVQPARVPSVVECSLCDIEDCPDRAAPGNESLTATGDVF
jgi:PD-(D/E)XK nuclease superfamily protein